MKHLTRIFFALACLALAVAPAFSQEDAEGIADVPYFTRMPHFYIYQGSVKDFDEYQLTDGKKLFSVEGKVYQTNYRQKDDGSSIVSELQVRRNLLAALQKIGATIVFDGAFLDFPDTRSNVHMVTARMKKGTAEVWFEVWPLESDYTLTVIEVKSMRQDVSATDMLDALNKDGRIALQVNFDTAKSTIKDESRPTIEQIVQLLKDNPALKLNIEGHTDNVGDAKSNKTLSEQRAKSVVDAVVKAGIDPARLAAAGFGQDRPVADNKTEEGRAKNRRVELVKQ